MDEMVRHGEWFLLPLQVGFFFGRVYAYVFEGAAVQGYAKPLVSVLSEPIEFYVEFGSVLLVCIDEMKNETPNFLIRFHQLFGSIHQFFGSVLEFMTMGSLKEKFSSYFLDF